MKKKHILTLLGFALFLLGFVGIVVNLIGLSFALTDWMTLIVGPTLGFCFKILLIIAGLVLAVVANGNKDEDTFDEYFDGKTFK
jgi:hypothetical protein